MDMKKAMLGTFEQKKEATRDFYGWTPTDVETMAFETKKYVYRLFHEPGFHTGHLVKDIVANDLLAIEQKILVYHATLETADMKRRLMQEGDDDEED